MSSRRLSGTEQRSRQASEQRSDDAAVSSLPPELLLLFDALRTELDAKVSALKAWGIAMTVCGGTIGGFIAALKSDFVSNSAHAAFHFLS